MSKDYLPFQERKRRDVTKKVNAVIKHTEADDITETNKLAIGAAL